MHRGSIWRPFSANWVALGLTRYLFPLAEFDIIGFSLQYELTYTNILMMLDLGRIPLLSRERNASHPLIIAAVPARFIQSRLPTSSTLFFGGMAKKAIFDICDAYCAWDKKDRKDLLQP